MRQFWLTLLFLVIQWVPVSSIYAAVGCPNMYGNGQCVSASGLTMPPNADYWGVVGGRLVDNGGGYFACQFYTASGDSWQQFGTCELCDFPKVMVNGQCVMGECQAPKIDDGNGGCKCPDNQIEQNEQCIDKPDCTKKQAECSTACGGIDGSMTNVAHFYCEVSTASDPSTQLFSDSTYSCECNKTDGCTSPQVQVYSLDGSTSCKNPNPDSGCPQGSYYGEYNGLKGCIQPNENLDPDEPKNNCLEGQKAVYFGSTLYCQPKPNTSDCPAGTTLYLAIGTTKLCKAPDNTGNSPDTNGVVNGTPSGNGGSGSGAGDDNTDNNNGGVDTAEGKDYSAVLGDIKTNTGKINDALTGSASTVQKGSFLQAKAQTQAEVDQLKLDYKQKISELKAQVSSFFDTDVGLSGSGSLPCFQNATFMGQTLEMCFSDYEDELSIVGTIFYAFSLLLVGLMIIRGLGH